MIYFLDCECGLNFLYLCYHLCLISWLLFLVLVMSIGTIAIDITINGKILSMTVFSKANIRVIYICSINVNIIVIIVGEIYIRVTYKVNCYLYADYCWDYY